LLIFLQKLKTGIFRNEDKRVLMKFLKLFFFSLVLVLFSCESSSQKESKRVLAKNPWLKPFIFNAPKIVSKASDSIARRHFTRISDSAILHTVKLAHDFLRDDPSDKERNRSFYALIGNNTKRL